MNSFRDPVTNVLKAYGTVTTNAPGDLVNAEADTFNLTPGQWVFVSGAWQKYDAIIVPRTVTMRQARLALLGAGLLDTVNNTIAGMAGAQGQAAQIEWQYSSEVQRHKALVQSLGPALGLTDAQLDQLFITAATL